MPFGKKKAAAKTEKKYTSVGLGLYDKGEFLLGKIPVERFVEYAAKFKEAREKGVSLVMFVRENSKGGKPDYWANLDLDKPKPVQEEIEEEAEEQPSGDDPNAF